MLATHILDTPARKAVKDIDGLWCVLRTWGGREFVVAEALLKAGVGHFLPYTEVRRLYRSKKITAKVPAFANYVFSACPIDERGGDYDGGALYDIRGTKYVSEVIRVPSWQRRRLVSDLEWMEQWMEEAKVYGEFFESDVFLPGRRVRVVSGKYEGLEGDVVKRRDKEVIQVGVTLLGQCLVRDIDELDIETVASAN